METFPANYYTFQTEYQPSGSSLQFGGGYAFTSKPDSPTQRKITLNLTGMKYYVNEDGTLDLTTNADKNNLGVLEAFMAARGQWDPFTLNHPVYGALTVLVTTPFSIPKGISGGGGVVDDLQVVVMEQP